MIDRDGEVRRIERDARALPNQITGPNAGGRCQFPIRIPLAARVGQFNRSVKQVTRYECDLRRNLDYRLPDRAIGV